MLKFSSNATVALAMALSLAFQACSSGSPTAPQGPAHARIDPSSTGAGLDLMVDEVSPDSFLVSWKSAAADERRSARVALPRSEDVQILGDGHVIGRVAGKLVELTDVVVAPDGRSVSANIVVGGGRQVRIGLSDLPVPDASWQLPGAGNGSQKVAFFLPVTLIIGLGAIGIAGQNYITNNAIWEMLLVLMGQCGKRLEDAQKQCYARIQPNTVPYFHSFFGMVTRDQMDVSVFGWWTGASTEKMWKYLETCHFICLQVPKVCAKSAPCMAKLFGKTFGLQGPAQIDLLKEMEKERLRVKAAAAKMVPKSLDLGFAGDLPPAPPPEGSSPVDGDGEDTLTDEEAERIATEVYATFAENPASFPEVTPEVIAAAQQDPAFQQALADLGDPIAAEVALILALNFGPGAPPDPPPAPPPPTPPAEPVTIDPPTTPYAP